MSFRLPSWLWWQRLTVGWLSVVVPAFALLASFKPIEADDTPVLVERTMKGNGAKLRIPVFFAA